MYEAIQLHVDGMLKDGLPIPEPSSSAEYVILPSSAGSAA